jgi:hypothetical protein
MGHHGSKTSVITRTRYCSDRWTRPVKEILGLGSSLLAKTRTVGTSTALASPISRIRSLISQFGERRIRGRLSPQVPTVMAPGCSDHVWHETSTDTSRSGPQGPQTAFGCGKPTCTTMIHRSTSMQAMVVTYTPGGTLLTSGFALVN